MMSKDNPKPQESTHSLDDAFPLNGIEFRLETIIEQNEEIIKLLEKLSLLAQPMTAKWGTLSENGGKKK